MRVILISSRAEVSPLCRWTRWCGGCNTGAPGGSVERPGHLCIPSGRGGNSRNPPDGSRLGQEQSPAVHQASQGGWNWNQNPCVTSLPFTRQCASRHFYTIFSILASLSQHWVRADELVLAETQVGQALGLTWTWRPGLYCELSLLPDSLWWLSDLNNQYKEALQADFLGPNKLQMWQKLWKYEKTNNNILLL